MGDFDYNDLVVSTRTVYAQKANNNFVCAEVEMVIDGVGAGYHNGVGCRFLNMSAGMYSELPQQMLSSVSGTGSVDGTTSNVVLISDDVYLLQSTYYQNNGSGPTAAAEGVLFGQSDDNSIISGGYYHKTASRLP